ncbi:MAG: hypothetical protein IPL48_16155 [Bacteroidetes bacterium]|nr:hypothetical protein [Bacteroidota bacterium]
MGDKLAGRRGNKGIVARIVRSEEHAPFREGMEPCRYGVESAGCSFQNEPLVRYKKPF